MCYNYIVTIHVSTLDCNLYMYITISTIAVKMKENYIKIILILYLKLTFVYEELNLANVSDFCKNAKLTMR